MEGNQLLYHLVVRTFVFWWCGLNGKKIKQLFRMPRGNAVKAGGDNFCRFTVYVILRTLCALSWWLSKLESD